MLVGYATVAIFFLVSIGFILVSMVAGRFIRPMRTSTELTETYECGEAPVGQAWFNFNPRFYIIALIYIVFDVEIAFIYPIATVYRSMIEAQQGMLVLGEVLTFVVILLLGLAYVWAKGDLEWIRTLREEPEPLGIRVGDSQEVNTTVSKPSTPAEAVPSNF